MLVLLLWFTFSFQDLPLSGLGNWESQAKQWMTAEEATLFEELSSSEREQFKGIFIARRLERPDEWPNSGLQLPHFFIPSKFGDIRDAISFVLGAPKRVVPGTFDENLPTAWVYEDYQFNFKPLSQTKVQLLEKRSESWEKLVQSLVLHPGIRYDFRKLTLGRNRLPDEIKWLPASLSGTWRIPSPEGTRWRVEVTVSEDFFKQFEAKGIGKTQTMEMLVFLKNSTQSQITEVEPFYIRHASKRFNFEEVKTLVFETNLPSGNFSAEMVFYSGYLPWGMRAETKVSSLPTNLPRIGDPMFSGSWTTAGIKVSETSQLLAGNTYYDISPSPQSNPSRVLVASTHPKTELFLHRENHKPVSLELLEQSSGWVVFNCPTLTSHDRLIALGYPEKGNLVAVSGWGSTRTTTTQEGPTAAFDTSKNYLELEQLAFSKTPSLQLLSVGTQPFLASTEGSFPWPALDWGKEATLRLEFLQDGQWFSKEFPIRRNQVFQEIRVEPKFLVAGFRDLEGNPSQASFQVEAEGLPLPTGKQTPLKGLAKQWGIVISDPLLKSPAWPEIRESVARWLRENTDENDYIYLVHISTRPKLALAPTRNKPTVLATLKSLRSENQLENYFTVRYLFEGLTQLPLHQSMPHQVLLLTHQLTEEVSQMETLLPLLRDTGLQLYNLEFPYEFQPESQSRIDPDRENDLLVMKTRAEEEERTYGFLRNKFEEPNPFVGLGWRFYFRTRAQKQSAAEEQIRLEAFHRAFNQQLANLTAGMALESGAGETHQSIFHFFEALTQWQNSLIHIELAVPLLSADMIQMKPQPGHTAAWTLVSWQP